MLGGLPRRLSLLAALQHKAQSLLLLSNGHAASAHQRHPIDKVFAEATMVQDRMKFETMLIGMNEMGYKAMNLSPWELRLGRKALIDIQKDVSFPLVATNLTLIGEPRLELARGVRVPWPGGQALVVGVIGFSQQNLAPPDAHAKLDDPLAAIRAAQKELGPKLPLVVLAQMTEEEGRELAKQLPELAMLALPASAGSSERPEALGSDRPFLFTTGADGKYLAVASVGADASTSIAFDTPAVESSYADDPAIVSLLDILEQRYEAEEVLGHFYAAKKPTVQGRAYVGSSTCGNAGCHPAAVAKLADSRHMRAWQTLVDERHTFDPDCVGCHVTGYTFATGFAGATATPALVNVTCEECHGPASEHIKDPKAPYREQKKECEECHNSDHSPRFRKGIYLGRIEHGKD
jgi:2',3'-cyclic-nucleotide 2'-phosphodiesterase (5'-nucleotidase family)